MASLRPCVISYYFSFNTVVTAAPDVYTKPPPQPTVAKPGQLTAEQVEQYFHDGFLIVPNFFKDDELNPVLRAIEYHVDVLANKLYNGGKIQDKAENSGVFHRLIHLENQFPGANILLFKILDHLPVFNFNNYGKTTVY